MDEVDYHITIAWWVPVGVCIPEIWILPQTESLCLDLCRTHRDMANSNNETINISNLNFSIRYLSYNCWCKSVSKRSLGTASALLSGPWSSKTRLRARRLASAAPCESLQIGGLKRIGLCNIVNGYDCSVVKPTLSNYYTIRRALHPFSLPGGKHDAPGYYEVDNLCHSVVLKMAALRSSSSIA